MFVVLMDSPIPGFCGGNKPRIENEQKNYIHKLPTDYWGSEIHFKIPLHEHELSHHFYLAINENPIYLFIYLHNLARGETQRTPLLPGQIFISPETFGLIGENKQPRLLAITSCPANAGKLFAGVPCTERYYH